jgi:hypothetical protein
MNHQKVYDNIIQKAKNENRVKHKGNYYENHHIIPRCLNGGDEKENKVLLTAKEHFICHKLLTYIYPGNRSLVYAFHMMTIPYKERKIYISARDYSYLKELRSKTGFSEETLERMRKAQKENNHWKGKHHTEETKRIMRESHKLRIPISEETRKKLQGNTSTLGKHWKVKDTSKMKHTSSTKGLNWKIKDTSNYKGNRNGAANLGKHYKHRDLVIIE